MDVRPSFLKLVEIKKRTVIRHTSLCQQENMNADSLNKEKKTPYEMAVINNDTEMMEILREHAATAFRNVNYLNIITYHRNIISLKCRYSKSEPQLL